jgi:type II secretory pathway predicted ATPase ExeA
MTYLDFFQLRQEPFSNAPLSQFYFHSAQHEQALMRLWHAVQGMKGLSLLVGDIGAGKTMLARRLLDMLPEEEYEAALLIIIHSGVSATWLLRRIAVQLGVEDAGTEKLPLLSQLYQRLLDIYDSGRKAVVLVDEAQILQSRELMEEFRGLLNLEVPGAKLISFVFFGLPELERNLKLDPPLAQRVALRYKLQPFTAESTSDYIHHRLRLVECPHVPFSQEAIEAIHRHVRGVPRLINTLCDNALFEAFLTRQRHIDSMLIEQVASNMGLDFSNHPPPKEEVLEPPPMPPGAPKTNIDLAEIDRYLEGLGKASG